MMVRKSLVALAFIVGCATAVPPRELTNAQMAYMKAAQGPAATYVPDELHKAKKALDSAEAAFAKDPKAATTRDLAYIAERKSQLADAKAQVALAERQKAAATQDYTKTLEGMQKQTKDQLEKTKQQADAERREADAKLAREKDQARAQITAEQQAREEAERKAEAAIQDLAKIAQIREEARGTVISLSGDVLFETGKANLLSSAQLRLNQLADALMETDQKLIIEGHTDSRGSDSYNQDLSTRRASAVRDFLVGRGIPMERFQVVGFGESKPIADNKSPEGRALNRRVEIIIEGKKTAGR